MAFSDFTYDDLLPKLKVTLRNSGPLFPSVAPVEPSDYFREWLRRNYAVGTQSGGEKVRSEILISPMLLEAKFLSVRPISYFSGAELNVDASLGLKGFCDYVLCASEIQVAVTAPIVVLVEAKFENISAAIPQCIAEMVAADIINQRAGLRPEAIFGVVTTGVEWNFLRLRGGIVDIDPVRPTLADAPKILGILLEMLKVPILPIAAVPIAEVA